MIGQQDTAFLKYDFNVAPEDVEEFRGDMGRAHDLAQRLS